MDFMSLAKRKVKAHLSALQGIERIYDGIYVELTSQNKDIRFRVAPMDGHCLFEINSIEFSNTSHSRDYYLILKSLMEDHGLIVITSARSWEDKLIAHEKEHS